MTESGAEVLFEIVDGHIAVITPNRPQVRNAVNGAHERSHHPVLHRAKIGCLGDLGVEAITAFGDEAPVRLPAGSTTLGRIATSRILVFDRIHEHFAQAGRDRSHRRLGAFRQRGADRG